MLRRVAWLHVAPLLHGDFEPDALEWLARDRRVLLDGHGLVRVRRAGPLELDGDFDHDLLRHVSILKLSDEEAACSPAATRLHELGVPEVLVTHGVEGATVVTRDGTVEVPARRVDADPTGAGDVFSRRLPRLRARRATIAVSAARRATALVAALLAGRAR